MHEMRYQYYLSNVLKLSQQMYFIFESVYWNSDSRMSFSEIVNEGKLVMFLEKDEVVNCFRNTLFLYCAVMHTERRRIINFRCRSGIKIGDAHFLCWPNYLLWATLSVKKPTALSHTNSIWSLRKFETGKIHIRNNYSLKIFDDLTEV